MTTAAVNAVSIKNKKAYFNYEISETYVAGIVLYGSEIKTIRENKANLNDAYCAFIKDELYVRNLHISEYADASYNNHKVKRDRKLLLNRKELLKLAVLIQNKGFTIVPTKLFINERGLAKLEIGVGKGKKVYDKRETMKDRDVKRDIARVFRS